MYDNIIIAIAYVMSSILMLGNFMSEFLERC